jgi:hypothetical protein
MSELPWDLGTVRVVAHRPHLLQTFRAAHAICEAGASLAVTAEDSDRYGWLGRYFDVRYRLDDDAPVIEVEIDHAEPSVRVGELARPLLFAHAVIDAYRAAWSSPRPVRHSFAGLGTPDRRSAIARWAESNDLRMPSRLRRGSDDLDVRFTGAGRKWPEKGWDQGYVDALGRAQFALCPNGDFVWTYRFFEAAAGGAIPIIEDYCDLYDGFAFHTFDEPARGLEWTSSAAEHNATLVRQRLTAPLDDLASAVRAALRR